MTAYPKMTDPIDTTGLKPAAQCSTEFRRSGKHASVVMTITFETVAAAKEWHLDDIDRVLTVAADRNINIVLVTAPNLPIAGFQREWNHQGEICYAAF